MLCSTCLLCVLTFGSARQQGTVSKHIPQGRNAPKSIRQTSVASNSIYRDRTQQPALLRRERKLFRHSTSGLLETRRRERKLFRHVVSHELGTGDVIARGPSIAGLVAVHPPRFEFLYQFMLDWQRCTEGQAVMDVMPIFSNSDDAEKFAGIWKQRQSDKAAPWTPILVSTVPTGVQLSSWKKLYGVAHVLQNFAGSNYEFALMMDAEIGIASCQGFANMPSRLRQKHSAKIWYGDRMSSVKVLEMGPHMVRAACAVSRWPGSNIHSANPFECGDRQSMSKLDEATGHFTLYTWWNDVPYVHIDTAHRMFDHWAEGLHSHNLLKIAGETHASPVEVAEAMGSGYNATLTLAGSVFEHLAYQMYTVLFENFVVKDLTEHLRNHRGSSMGERFWDLDNTDKQAFLQTVQPLWLIGNASGWSSPGGPVLLKFNLDRFKWWENAPEFPFQW